MGYERGNMRRVSLSVADWLRATYIPRVIISFLIDKAGRGWKTKGTWIGMSERMAGEERIQDAFCVPLFTKKRKRKERTPTIF